MEKNKDFYPVTIIDDRYGGCYSGGKYLAFNLEPWDVPRGVSWGGDMDCAEFWTDEAYKYMVGKGDTPDEAYQDFVEKVQIEERELSLLNPQLDKKQTFENYIEGESNKLARRIGLSIAEHPDEVTYNPFYIYGPSGCGKSHLINAIGVRYKEMFPEKRLLYAGAHKFQVQYTDSVRKNTTNRFVNFYQSADLLIIDDIQEWINAPKTLETFFHIFNHLVSCGKQIILACNRPPVDLQGMKKRVLTRFGGGVVAELEMPNKQLCIDILDAMCRHDGLKVSSNIIEYIVKKVNGNICILEGVLNSLKAYSLVNDSNIDLNLAERVMMRFTKQN